MKVSRNTPEGYIFHHLHEIQRVAPSGLIPIGLASGAGAYNLGNFSNDILGAGIVPAAFALDWLVTPNPSADVWYEVVFYYGGADIECARATFAKDNQFSGPIGVPLKTPVLPSGSRIRAKMMDSIGAATCDIKIFYHQY